MGTPELPSDAVVLGGKDVESVQKVRDLTPTVDRLAEECGASVRTEVNVFGREEKVATVPFKTVLEAMKPAWRKDTEHQSEVQAGRPMETLRGPNGEQQKVWSIHAPQVAEVKGLKPAWRARGVRIMRGSNGNLWREDGHGGWEDTGKTCLTRPLFEGDDRTTPRVVIH